MSDSTFAVTIMAIISAVAIVIAALTGQQSAPAVKPHSYLTTVHRDGRVLSCVMTVDANGNGSLNNCSAA